MALTNLFKFKYNTYLFLDNRLGKKTSYHFNSCTKYVYVMCGGKALPKHHWIDWHIPLFFMSHLQYHLHIKLPKFTKYSLFLFPLFYPIVTAVNHYILLCFTSFALNLISPPTRKCTEYTLRYLKNWKNQRQNPEGTNKKVTKIRSLPQEQR